MDNRIGHILEYAARLKEEKLCGENDYIALRIDDKDMYVTKGALGSLTESDVVRESYKKGVTAAAVIFNTYDVNAIIYSHPEKSCVVAKSGRTIVASLDDMAQIVGYKCKACQNRTDKIIPALKGANSILIKDDGALTTGRTLDEAFTCMMVLEKAARVFVAGSVLGGCKHIGAFDARLMRLVYKLKYSKKNQKNKSQEEM